MNKNIKKNKDNLKKKQVNILLTEKEFEELGLIALLDSRAISSYVRLLVVKDLNKNGLEKIK